MEGFHPETLEEEATHATDEARMVLPGVQTILGFQLIAAFSQKFDELSHADQLLHLAAFLLVALAMGLIMAPAAYHRQAERGCLSRRFVTLASVLLTLAMLPLIAGLSIDGYLLSRMILKDLLPSLVIAAAMTIVLAALWFALPHVLKRRRGE